MKHLRHTIVVVVVCVATLSADAQQVCPLAPSVGGQLCADLQDTDCANLALDAVCLPRIVVINADGFPRAQECQCFEGPDCGPVEVTPTPIPEDFILSCPGGCPDPPGGPCEIIVNNQPTGQPSVNSSSLEPGSAVRCACTEVPPPLCPEPDGSIVCDGLQQRDCVSFDPDAQCRARLVTSNNFGQPEPLQCGCFPPDGTCGPVQIDGNVLSCPGGCPNDPGSACQIHVSNMPTGMGSISAGDLPPGAVVSCECAAPPAEQACCVPESALTCFFVDPATCLEFGGTPQGPNSMCLGLEACCLPNGQCLLLDRLCCPELGGQPQGPGSSCSGSGACCLDIDDGPLAFDTCLQADGTCCEAGGGVFQGVGASCATEACCLPGGFCQETDPECCEASGGFPQGPGSICNFQCEPIPVGACCFDVDDGPLAYDTCLITDQISCLQGGGIFEGPGSTCTTEACCLPSGFCQEADPECCEASGGFPQGPNSMCNFQCEPIPVGACCFDIDDGPLTYDTCLITDQISCLEGGGIFEGPESTCTTEACCLPNGFCQDADPECCLASKGAPQGPGSNCADIGQCAPLGACCFDFDDGPLTYDVCVVTDAESCLGQGGLFQGPGSTCTSEACCLPVGFCQNADPQCCQASGGQPQGPNSDCSEVLECPTFGACCFDIDDGPLTFDTCVVTDVESCLGGGGVFQGAGSVCTTESCCLPDGFCQDADPQCCLASGGQPQGPGTECAFTKCLPPAGACCFDGDGDSIPESCEVVPALVCNELGGNFQGLGTECGGIGACCFGIIGGACVEMDKTCCASLSGNLFLGLGSVCLGDSDGSGLDDRCECPADFDGSGAIGPIDLALLLGAWGPCECCPQDLNHNGAVGPADLALLLGEWGECP